MRKLLILLIITTLTSAASAQEWSFGPKVGANMSSIIENPIIFKYSAGYRAGIFAEYTFNRVGIEADFLFSRQGINLYEVGAFAIRRHTKSSYIIIPVKAKVYVTNKKTSGLYVFAGPELDISLKHEKLTFSNEHNNDNKIIYEVNTKTLALNFGAGYKFNNGIGISMGYTNGVIPFEKTNLGKQYNSNYDLSVSYNFLSLKRMNKK